MMTAKEREEYLVDRYGECVTATVAAKIIGRGAATVRTMMREGRLDAVCGGTMVCMHSIAHYIDKPKEIDSKARATKAGRKWHVI